MMMVGLPWQFTGKESACNAGDPGSILGQDDPLEKGQATHSSVLGLPSWLMVKNPPAVWRPGYNHWVGKIPWRRAQQTHSSTLAWRIPTDRGACGLQSTGLQSIRHDLSDQAQHSMVMVTYSVTMRKTILLYNLIFFHLFLFVGG